MGNWLQLYRFMPLGVSCLIHLGLVAGAIALGRDLATWKTSTVVMAELVPAEPPRSAEPPKPTVTPRPESRKRENLALPKPIATPIREPVTASEPVDPPPLPPSVETTPVETKPEPQPRIVAAPQPALPAAPGNVTITQAPPTSSDPGPSASNVRSAFELSPTAASRPAAERPSTASAVPGDSITRTVRPSYPGTARRLGIQGTTTLRIFVAVDGRVTDVVVEQSAGHPDLDHAATDAVRRWRFEPARRGTEAVGMWVLLPVEFRLK